MDALAKIRVHVPFPPVNEAEMPVLQSETWEWVLCLEIPADLLVNHYFSLKPYKWIRYATGVVVGAFGHLSHHKEQVGDLNYDAADLENCAGDLYYHPDEAERGRMFPTDPQLANSRITSSVTTSRRAGYRDQARERDGTCVLTNRSAEVCDGAHLFAHSKGDEVSGFPSRLHKTHTPIVYLHFHHLSQPRSSRS